MAERDSQPWKLQEIPPRQLEQWAREAKALQEEIFSAPYLSEWEKRRYIAEHVVQILATVDLSIIKVILFGSVARRQARPDSDTDLICVTNQIFNTSEEEHMRRGALLDVLRRIGYITGHTPRGIGIAFLFPNDLVDPREMPDPSIAISVQREGITLFDRNQTRAHRHFPSIL